MVFAGIAVMIVMVALWLAFVPRLPTVSGASCSLTGKKTLCVAGLTAKLRKNLERNFLSTRMPRSN